MIDVLYVYIDWHRLEGIGTAVVMVLLVGQVCFVCCVKYNRRLSASNNLPHSRENHVAL